MKNRGSRLKVILEDVGFIGSTNKSHVHTMYQMKKGSQRPPISENLATKALSLTSSNVKPNVR